MRSFKNLLVHIAKPITNRIFDLKNLNHGESCYIYGDGVTIKWFDLLALQKRPGFSLGCMPFHNQGSALDLKYGLLIEPYYFYPFLKLPSWSKGKRWWRNTINRKYIDLFRENLNVHYFVNLSNYPVLTGNNIYYLFQAIGDTSFPLLKDCKSNNIGMLDGSLRCSIALAIYMGFKDIILVGCDYTHEISRSMHWYERGEGIVIKQPDYERNFLEFAQKYASITTLTLEGAGSVLPSITYSDYTGKAANYRENYELLDDTTLKLLATWPGYNIL